MTLLAKARASKRRLLAYGLSDHYVEFLHHPPLGLRAQKFEHLLDAYRRPDGHRWTGQQLDEATGGVVTRSDVTNLRKGCIENPGYEKMRAIAKVMGFAPEVWFKDGLGEGRSIGQAEESRGYTVDWSICSRLSGTRRQESLTPTLRLLA